MPDADGLADALADGDAEPLADPLAEGDAEALPDALGLADALALADALGDDSAGGGVSGAIVALDGGLRKPPGARISA